ncbi:hypothetical protein LTR53_007778 [Teratosphaeriaceae sp. CCFEE 6253]|nr:hypothetical protein LTR53_007778 [Teratosphaeriaceae sp. CCFEE 6253]
MPAIWIKGQIQTSIHGYTTTKSIKVIAAHQLKSGDIEIFTSTTTEAAQLKVHQEWLKGLGQRAEVIVPTYGVIVHGISTGSINTKDQTATIQQILADNHTVIPDAKIAYVGWLTREATHKRSSSIVLEFTDPERANAIIYAGMAWEGQIHQCQLYDRACRIKQCFRCYHYGHIGTQCNTSQICGYCAEPHETKQCRQKSTEGFAPRCTVHKGAHTAWSNACPARKKEVVRVEQAKQIRSIYWRVPSRVHATPPRIEGRASTDTSQEEVQPSEHRTVSGNQSQAGTQDSTDSAEPGPGQIEPPAPVPPRTENDPFQTQPPVDAERPHDGITVQTTQQVPFTEVQALPATQQESQSGQPGFPIDP